MQPEIQPRLYSDLAAWWPLFSPPSHYVEEAVELFPLLFSATEGEPQTLLELGCGGGSLAYHLKNRLRLTLTDRSEEMLAVCRRVNPECELIHGDMRTLDLGRRFDLVLIHDAIMYATDEASVRAVVSTAYRHCRPGGAALLLPDFTKETFKPGTSTGGEDGSDGRGLRYLEWMWDPNPDDTTVEVAFAFLLRDVDGAISVDRDRHRFGLFPHAAWMKWVQEAGFSVRSQRDSWGRDVLIAAKRIMGS